MCTLTEIEIKHFNPTIKEHNFENRKQAQDYAFKQLQKICPFPLTYEIGSSIYEVDKARYLLIWSDDEYSVDCFNDGLCHELTFSLKK